MKSEVVITIVTNDDTNNGIQRGLAEIKRWVQNGWMKGESCNDTTTITLTTRKLRTRIKKNI